MICIVGRTLVRSISFLTVVSYVTIALRPPIRNHYIHLSYIHFSSLVEALNGNVGLAPAYVPKF